MLLIDAEYDDSAIYTAAIALDDVKLKAGRSNDEEEAPSNGELDNVTLPSVEEGRKEEVRSWQLSPVVQNIIQFRLWVDKMGQVKALIVIDESTLSQMLAKYHGDNHRGFWPTFGYFAERYYCFHLRKFIQNYISACPTCTLNNLEKHGFPPKFVTQLVDTAGDYKPRKPTKKQLRKAEAEAEECEVFGPPNIPAKRDHIP